MKNITLSAEEKLINQARLRGRMEKLSLNGAFREWLGKYTNRAGSVQEYDSLISRLGHVRSGRRFTREEMNGR